MTGSLTSAVEVAELIGVPQTGVDERSDLTIAASAG